MADKLVFVVDDESALADAVSAYLTENGLRVAVFTNPGQALVAAVSARPDLLLSDFRMAEMDGLSLATKIRELHPACKVLIMSGRLHDIADIPAELEVELMAKPLRMSVLLAKVKAALANGS